MKKYKNGEIIVAHSNFDVYIEEWLKVAIPFFNEKINYYQEEFLRTGKIFVNRRICRTAWRQGHRYSYKERPKNAGSQCPRVGFDMGGFGRKR